MAGSCAVENGTTAIRYLRQADQRVLRFVDKGAPEALGIYLRTFEVQRRLGSTAYTKLVLHADVIS